MNDNQHEHFFNVRMPRWYRAACVVFWSLCAMGIVSVVALHAYDFVSIGTTIGVVIGVGLLAMLPGIPKAFIEQRNRLRGLKDGSFQEYLKRIEGKDDP